MTEILMVTTSVRRPFATRQSCMTQFSHTFFSSISVLFCFFLLLSLFVILIVVVIIVIIIIVVVVVVVVVVVIVVVVLAALLNLQASALHFCCIG